MKVGRVVRVNRWWVLVVAVTGAAMLPAEVGAGEFEIGACGADREYATGAFDDFVTRGMRVKRACNPEGPGLRGLVTANVVRGGSVRRGARQRSGADRWLGRSRVGACSWRAAGVGIGQANRGRALLGGNAGGNDMGTNRVLV